MAISLVPPKVILRSATLRELPGYKLSVCSVTGSLPIYTALIWNSTVLVNATNTVVTIALKKEGNYTCVATSKYGTDVKEFSVIFNGKMRLVNFGPTNNESSSKYFLSQAIGQSASHDVISSNLYWYIRRFFKI